MTSLMIHSAPLLIPVAGPPVRDGAIAVRRGRVLQAGPRARLRSAFPGRPETRWPGVIVPGLVNAHTHLQYTCLAAVGAAAYGSYEEWAWAFQAAYDGEEKPDWAMSAAEGARSCLATGTTAVADVVTDLEAAGAAAGAGLYGIAYLEVLGDTEERWEAAGRDELITALREADHPGPLGISPHAPYSLDTGVLEDLALLARTFGLRSHLHVAESAHEREYTVSGTGPLARMVREMGFEFTVMREGGTGRGPVEFLDALGVLGPDCHVAHGVYLTAAERRILRRRGTVVALCPRSNRTLGLDPPDVAALLAEGNPIAVGTDSLSSAPSLDLLEDVRLLRELARAQGYRGADLDRRLVAAATAGGARALGRHTGPGRIGVLAAGARADFAVFDVDPGTAEPYRTLIEEAPGRCVATVVGGTVKFTSPGPFQC